MPPKAGHFNFKDWAQLILTLTAVWSVVVGFFGWAFFQWTEWRDIPDRMRQIEEAIVQLNIGSSPEIIQFRGSGIPSQTSVKAGDTIQVVYVLRRNIDCDTTINVRFYDFDKNAIAAEQYRISAVRSPVSKQFGVFSVSVKIPESLKTGLYGYFPEIIPESCGVYSIQIPPLSLPFEVRND